MRLRVFARKKYAVTVFSMLKGILKPTIYFNVLKPLRLRASARKKYAVTVFSMLKAILKPTAYFNVLNLCVLAPPREKKIFSHSIQYVKSYFETHNLFQRFKPLRLRVFARKKYSVTVFSMLKAVLKPTIYFNVLNLCASASSRERSMQSQYSVC